VIHRQRSRRFPGCIQLIFDVWSLAMSRLKLIGAALLLVIFETYTASAAQPVVSHSDGAGESRSTAAFAGVLATTADLVIE
jgi:hypothetical protein